MLSTKFRFIWPSGFRGDDFFYRNKPIRNKNYLWWPCLLTDWKQMSTLYRGPSKDASYHILIHLAKRLQRRRFLRNQPIRNKILSVVAIFDNGSGLNEQSLQRTYQRCYLPSFSSFGQAVSEENIYLNRPIRNKNCLWWPCLLMDLKKNQQSLERTFHSIDASYQVSLHLAEGFQEKIKM